jgi:hypothetical protein
VSERKHGDEYYRGYEDAQRGAAPDYSQASNEQFMDYCDGYHAGLRDRARQGMA